MPDLGISLTWSAGTVLLAWNVATMLMMGWDKLIAKSRKGRKAGPRRVPEAVLLGSAVLMGAAGIWAGMYLFHHKTLHRVFSIGVPIAFLLNAVILKQLGIVIA